jgi:transposase
MEGMWMDDAEAVGQETELVERVAAIDVAKASGMLCVRLPHDRIEGRRTQRVWNVGATTNAILELGDHLLCQGVTRVVMEATGSYWKPWFYLLEARGLECWLVNARDVKNVPGRPKTDKLDAVWLCKLAERGMLRASFVPLQPVRELRDLTRLRTVFIGERSRNKQRTEKVLEDAQIKLSSVATNIFGVSGRSIIEALIRGERSPQTLADLARGRLVSKHDALVEALTGQFNDHHAYVCRLLLDSVDRITAQVDDLSQRISAQLAGISPPQTDEGGGHPGSTPGETGGAGLLPLVERLDEIPGIGRTAAEVIVAELGPDMRVFPTSGHLVSWAKLAPPARSSPAVRTPQGPPDTGIPGSRESSARPPWPRPAPTPSSGPATADSSNTGVTRRPSSPWPVRCWSSSGISSTTQPPVSKTSDPTTTSVWSTLSAGRGNSSASSKHSDMPSPSPLSRRSPDHTHRLPDIRSADTERALLPVRRIVYFPFSNPGLLRGPPWRRENGAGLVRDADVSVMPVSSSVSMALGTADRDRQLLLQHADQILQPCGPSGRRLVGLSRRCPGGVHGRVARAVRRFGHR